MKTYNNNGERWYDKKSQGEPAVRAGFVYRDGSASLQVKVRDGGRDVLVSVELTKEQMQLLAAKNDDCLRFVY